MLGRARLLKMPIRLLQFWVGAQALGFHLRLPVLPLGRLGAGVSMLNSGNFGFAARSAVEERAPGRHFGMRRRGRCLDAGQPENWSVKIARRRVTLHLHSPIFGFAYRDVSYPRSMPSSESSMLLLRELFAAKL